MDATPIPDAPIPHARGFNLHCAGPDADLAMVLACSEDQPGLAGISLFLLPKLQQNGTPNAYRILRLKDKLGTRSMVSGEIRLEGAEAWPGRPNRPTSRTAARLRTSSCATASPPATPWPRRTARR